MGAPLTWKLHEELIDEYDSTYVEYRCWRAFAGTKRVAEVKVWYGDSNSANSTRGSIHMATSTGMFKKDWLSRGYTWKPAHPYHPACVTDLEPRQWVDGRWAKWLAETGL